MSKRYKGNPGGIGFSELMQCPQDLFERVLEVIEAGRWTEARALLRLSPAPDTLSRRPRKPKR